jgi:HAD superfamily hydrolase (TIGR01509 family)
MPYHAEAWKRTMNAHGIPFELHDAYVCEGRTGASVINEMFLKHHNRLATEEEFQLMYREKSDCFNSISVVERIPNILPLLEQLKADGIDIYIVTGSGQESLLDRLNKWFPDILPLLEQLKADGIDIYIVTGSGQESLLDRLNKWFPGTFCKEKMVTAFDVKKGKPDPEPYLIALAKSGVQPNEAFVVENAPLGVRSSVAAGLFTFAVNTGILTTEELECEINHSGIVLPDMKAVKEYYETNLKTLK